MNLYNISQEVLALEEMIINDAGEFTEDHEELQKYVNNMLTHKVDNFVNFIQKQEDQVEIAKKRKDEIAKFIKQREQLIERLKSYVMNCMKVLNTEKLEGNLHCLKFRKPSQIVEIIDENKIPEEYVKIIVERKIDKIALKDELKKGVVIEGVCLSNGKESLIIK